MVANLRTTPGRSSPLGPTVSREGVNFSVFSKASTRMELLFFDDDDDAKPSAVIPLSHQEPYVPLLACLCARHSARPDLRLSCVRSIRT